MILYVSITQRLKTLRDCKTKNHLKIKAILKRTSFRFFWINFLIFGSQTECITADLYK